MERKSHLVRQQDIADALGVSLNTVSHALRDCKDISKETIAKVKEKAKELGYVSNNIAYYLVNGKTNFIAIAFPSLQNPYYLIMISYLLADLREKGLDGLLIPVNDIMNEQTLEKILINRCSGLITFIEPQEKTALVLEERKIPVVLLGSNSPYPWIDSVYTDDYDGGSQVGKIFLSSESNKALYIGNSFTETSKRRAEGFLNATGNEKEVKTYFLSFAEYKNMDPLFDFIEQGQFDFIFTHNDELGITIKRHFNIFLDSKIKIFGYDNISGYLNVCERINSVSSSYQDLSHYCVDLMKKRFDEEELSHPQKKVFPVKVSFNAN